MSMLLDKVFIQKLSALLEKSLFEVTSNYGISVTHKDPYTQEDFVDAVICSIGITGPFNGNLIIILPQSTACQLVSKLVGDTYTEVSDDVLDGCRELANMVAGVLMMGLSAQSCEVNIGLPTSFKGHAMHVRHNPIDKYVHQQYSSTIGDIEMIMVGRENASRIHEQSAGNSADAPKGAVNNLLDKMKDNPPPK